MINVSETAASNQRAVGRRTKAGVAGCCARRRLLGFQFGLMIEENGQGGRSNPESHGVKLFVDPISIQYLKNAEVDFADTITGGGFTIKNPNAKSTCGRGSSFSTESRCTDLPAQPICPTGDWDGDLDHADIEDPTTINRDCSMSSARI